MKETNSIVIVGSARTPIGSFQGTLASLKAPTLGAIAIEAALKRANFNAKEIDEVLMGCVLCAGLRQSPARQASLKAGISNTTSCTTINKVCGSGMKAIMLGYDLLRAGSNKIVVAGGMESMTNTPYLLDKARQGYRLGHGQIKDHLFLDGLEDAYETGKLMGVFADRTAQKYKITRKAQDEYAFNSLGRALDATKKKLFLTDYEITPVTIPLPKNQIIHIDQDEQPSRVDPKKIPTLKPAFHDNGTVTAASSSSISDGAATLVLMPHSEAKKRGLKPLAKILGHASYAEEPQWFTTAPVGAIKKLLKKLEWAPTMPDLYEINEAFAIVTMVAMQELKLPYQKVNIHGGACALGHPIGASGTRIVTTLLGALKRYQKQRGIAALCIGGGEATAIALELMDN